MHNQTLIYIRAIHLWRSQKIMFLTPSPCPHRPTPFPPLWTSTCGQHEIHIAFLKRLVQWPSRPKAGIRLYHCNLFKTVLLVIYINLWKISTFYSVQRGNSGEKDANFFAWEEDSMTSVDFNFNLLCGRPHGAWPPITPVRMCPPEPDPSPPSVWTS